MFKQHERCVLGGQLPERGRMRECGIVPSQALFLRRTLTVTFSAAENSEVFVCFLYDLAQYPTQCI